MRIKTFYAKTMTEALHEIKSTLGEDALLLSTKEIARRSGVRGKSSGFEVVAAIDNLEDVDVFSRSGAAKPDDVESWQFEPEPAANQGHSHPQVYSPEMIGIHANAASAEMTGEFSATDKGNPFNGAIALGLYRDLIRSGVEEHLAQTLLLIAQGSLSAGQRRSRAALIRSLSQAVLDRIALPLSQDGMPEKRVVVFVGPTGAGKTTSLAKLAAHLALQKKMKVVLMTLDGQRVGAVEQLRSYAGLMGIPFRCVDDVADMPQAVRENNQRDYILIDTAGRSPRDMKGMQRLADYLQQSEQIERHLVLSASTNPSDMRKIMDQFEICRPDHLLFTKLDETWSAGPILNELVRTQKCFSYYTDGLRVPDDLHAAHREQFMDIVLQRNDNAFKE